MSRPLDGVRSKIDRAKNHFQNLHATISTLFAPENDTTTAGHKYEADRQELIVTLQKAIPLDPTLPLIVGDCIHNARSALDYLVFQLAILNKAPIISATKTSFPVYLTPKEFKNAVRNKVAPFISASALAEIEKLQPYATGNARESDILWVLSQLDIIDKHRLLIVAVSKFRPTAFCVTVPTGEQFAHEIASDSWKASEDGAEIIRFYLSQPIKQPGKVNVEVKTATTLQIENTGLVCDGMQVEAVLSDCIQHVVNIIDGFGRLFFNE